MYAISGNSYRTVTANMDLLPGETLAEVLPAALVVQIDMGERRAERDQRLRESDWTQMADAPLTAPEKLAYSVYRQALRDLPALPGFPDVAWPQQPGLLNGAADEGGGGARNP